MVLGCQKAPQREQGAGVTKGEHIGGPLAWRIRQYHHVYNPSLSSNDRFANAMSVVQLEVKVTNLFCLSQLAHAIQACLQTCRSKGRNQLADLDKTTKDDSLRVRIDGMEVVCRCS